MIETRISSRYARALLNNANDTGNTEQVKANAEVFLKLGKSERHLLNILRSPVIPKEKKYRIVSRIFEERFDELTIRFLNLIIRKGRERFLVDIFTLFIDFYNVQNKISKATLITAAEIDEPLQKQVTKIVSEYTDTTVQLKTGQDESLIGGFVLTFSDKKLDASVASQLKELNKELAN